MKPIVYEVRRTFTSKFVIVMMISIIGLSALLSYESAVTFNSSPVAANTPTITYGYYVNGSNATIVSFLHDPYGTPSRNVDVYITTQGQTYEATSNNAGFANITVPIQPAARNTLTLNYSYRLFGSTVSTSPLDLSLYLSSGDYSGYSIVPGIISRGNTSNLGFQVFYVGANGSVSPNVSVYVGTYHTGENASELVSNSSSYKYSLSGFTERTIFPSIGTSQFNDTFAAAIASSNGSVIYPAYLPQSILGKLSIYTPMTQSVLQSLVFQGTGPILGILIPLLGIFAAYLTYGKDRTTGVLESVLKRPVTRGGLITSRFFANSVSIILAVIVSMIVGDLIINHYFQMYLSTDFLLYIIWTYVVEGLAFLSLVYMFAHLVKSQGALLGASIAIFVVFDLFWAIIPFAILRALSIPSTSSTYVLGNVLFDYISPSGYSNLTQLLFTKKLGFLGTHTINPAAYGVIPAILIAAGIIWIVAPMVAAYFLARSRD
jgi:ABC-2 type transport system permease protein